VRFLVVGRLPWNGLKIWFKQQDQVIAWLARFSTGLNANYFFHETPDYE